MAHTAIQPSDQDRYYAGDALRVPFHFSDEHNDQAIDLTDKTIEFRLKEDLTDPDTDAFLVKASDQTDDNGNPEIEITDAVNGECVVNILTDDTSEAVMDDTVRQSSATLMWHIRVFDADGARVTSETGDWEMWAS